MSKPAPKGRIKGSPAELDPMSPVNPLSRYHSALEQGRQYCTAHSKQKGTPCGRLAIPGSTVCRWHGGKAPQVQFKAQERLQALQPKAVGSLERLMDLIEMFPSTAYAAARDVLDRTIGKAAEVVRQEHTGSITIVHELERHEETEAPAPRRISAGKKAESV